MCGLNLKYTYSVWIMGLINVCRTGIRKEDEYI